ncbi:MAG TPA: glycosyltransferase family 39 protein [Candidatus Eisenbacteria bacterium]|nr:glycosyltransferase family 39 protein [Candidatus Eisenbacteria bacterium]
MRFLDRLNHGANSITVLVALLAASLVARAYLAASLGLQKDELFYAVWARTPDASYAWVPLAAVRASVAALGESAFAVRLPFVLAMTGAGVAAYALARSVTGSGAAAAWTVALLLGNVWAHFAGAQAHPDAFLACFWIAALAMLAPEERGRAALYLGAALAAGAALSKYTGYLLWPAWVVVELARRRASRRDILLASLLWLALVAPGVAAIVAERGHWLRVALHLSDLGDRVPAGARILLVLAAPLLYLASPGSLQFFAGPLASPRSGASGRAMLWIAAVVFLVFAVLAARGGVKGNWTLPALWGTLPFGVAWFLAGERRLRWLAACVAGGILVTAAAHFAAVRPEDAAAAVSGAAPLASLDRTYAATVSADERRHATARGWTDRLGEWNTAAPLADSLSRRARRGGAETAVASHLYEVVYAVRFHQPGTGARVMGDGRFRTRPEFAAGPEDLPRRILYVTTPGVELPEPFFLWYRFMEREPRLVVPAGGAGSKEYEVWKCGTDDEGW